jgi:hypothetical protein
MPMFLASFKGYIRAHDEAPCATYIFPNLMIIENVFFAIFELRLQPESRPSADERGENSQGHSTLRGIAQAAKRGRYRIQFNNNF